MTPTDADALAARLLRGLRTRLGGLHIDHARRVAGSLAGVGDDRLIAAALLHDVVEKAGISSEDLLRLTGDPLTVDVVDALTRRAGESERSYLTRCAADPLARLIKRADLLDKLRADDARSGASDAEELRREAQARLAVLEELIVELVGPVRRREAHPGWGGGGPPAEGGR